VGADAIVLINNEARRSAMQGAANSESFKALGDPSAASALLQISSVFGRMA